MPPVFNELAELAAKYVNTTHRHVFLTGKAGTGKTTFLTTIRDLTYKNAVVAAPTGIAAINAGGVTLHSLFQLPFGSFLPENIVPGMESGERFNTPKSVLSRLQLNKYKRRLIRELELLVIDEVSMLRADLLDCIDLILRHIRYRRSEPFGGVQILFIGDLLQLPPVVKNEEWNYLSKYYSSAFFFSARALQERPPVHIELDRIYRQSDQQFIDLLNRLRNNRLSSEDIDLLNAKYNSDFSPEPEDRYIHITTHNRKADTINENELQKIDRSLHTFMATVTGDFPENMYPAAETLGLKEGTQVMFIKNDPSGEQRFFNGKMAVVSEISDEGLTVQCEDGEKILAEQLVWENVRFTYNKESDEIEEKVIGSFSQYPLQLAWAITVHKSQGLTFEKAILDLSDVFAPGQMYVALSRLTSLDGLILSSPVNRSFFATNETVIEYSSRKESLKNLKSGLDTDRKEFLAAYVKQVFNFGSLVKELNKHRESFTMAENRSAKQQYLLWTVELINETFPLKEVGDKFIRQVNEIMTTSEDYLPRLGQRVMKAREYFLPLLENLAAKVNAHKKEVQKRKKIKGYNKELEEIEAWFQKCQKNVIKVHLFLEEASENRMLTRARLNSSSEIKTIQSAKETKKKMPTAEVSYNLFKEGKDLDEIASERGLVRGTIEGHMTKYVADGTLPVQTFLPEDKLENILTVQKLLKVHHASEIKSRLGEEYTYGDIRFALAHLRSLEPKET